MKTAFRLTLLRALLVMCVVTLLVGVSALSFAEGKIEVTVSMDQKTISAPGNVPVSVRVSNVSGANMKDGVTLYDPNGKLVSVFGEGGTAVLKKDEYKSVKMDLSVTEEMLTKGEIVYVAKYADQEVKGTAKFTYEKKEGALQVTRTFNPEVVRPKGNVSVTYELYNAGNVDLTTIKVSEKISSSPQSISSLKVGEKKSIVFKTKMGTKDLISSSTITYKEKGNTKLQTLKQGELIIPVAVKGLNVTLSSDKQAVDIGDTVKLILNIENKGNITYKDVSATDAKFGEIFTGLTIPANTTFTEEKEVTIKEPTRFKLTLKLNDNTGVANTLTVNELPVSAFDPTKELKITLLLTSDVEQIETMPQNVVMTVTVTNNSNIDAKNILVKHGATEIYTIKELKAGASVDIKCEYALSQAGQFRFTATAKDTIGNTVTFESNTLPIAFSAPTPEPTKVPEVTIAPLVTVAPANYSDVDQSLRTTRNILYTTYNVLGILFLVLLGLFLVSSVVRFKKKRQSSNAYDHLELAQKRDYSEEKTEDEVNEEKSVTLDDLKMPHEKLIQQLEEDAVSEERVLHDEDVKDVIENEINVGKNKVDDDKPSLENLPETDGLGAYRMTREESAEVPSVPKNTNKKNRRAVKQNTTNKNEEE